MEPIYLVFIIVWCILSIILFFKIWGMCNDVRKIKNNLLSDANQREFFGMCNDVRYIKKHLFQTSSQVDSSQAPSDNKDNTVVNEDTRFSVNQLVVVKQDESQFRVSYVSKENGEVKYFSAKHHKAFNEDEIEDFEKYWDSKKQSN